MRRLSLLACLAFASPTLAADDFKPEPDFTVIFNGKDLTGWTMKGKKDAGSLDGKTDAFNKRFVVAEGVLTIDPKVKGDVTIETAKPLGKDVHIKFDYKPGAGCNNDLFFRGTKFDLKKEDVKNIKWDEWNQFEIIAAGTKVEFKNNGETIKTMNAKSDGTPLGIRAELGPMQVRRLRVKEGS